MPQSDATHVSPHSPGPTVNTTHHPERVGSWTPGSMGEYHGLPEV